MNEVRLDVRCYFCSTGPAGMDGHPYLRVRTIGTAQTFNCQLCAGHWCRTWKAAGACAWSDITGRAAQGAECGMSLPLRYAPPHGVGRRA